MAQQVLVNGVDLTAYLQYGSMTVKFNTCDFTLIDGPVGAVTLGYSVVVKDPGWTGTVAQFTLADIVDRQTGHFSTNVSATNTATVGPIARDQFGLIIPDPGPFGLSDTPSAAAVSHFLKEDGSGVLVLEDGSAFAPGDYALESSSDTYGYRRLSVQKQTNTDLSVTTKLTATIFQPGLWPGQSVHVTSTNLGFGAAPTYVVYQVTTTWTAGTPTFTVEMASEITDIPRTLRGWRVSG